MLLEPGMNLTLRPMKYPVFYDMYRDAIKNTWTVEEVDFSTDVNDLRNKMGPAERHLINRLVAFFATGDSIVANNLVLNLYKHINSPEGRMYLSRQLYEEALHDFNTFLRIDPHKTTFIIGHNSIGFDISPNQIDYANEKYKSSRNIFTTSKSDILESDSESIEEKRLLRNIHTIKGNARSVGLLSLSTVVHELENNINK